MARTREDLTPGTKASARYIWITPSKVRQVADLITGKRVDEARRILAFTPKAAARHLSKVLESAIANAEHNYQIPQEELFVRSAWADEGPTHKRFQARARRAAFVIRKRTSHINVAVARLPEELREQPARPEGRPRRAAGEPKGRAAAQPEAGAEKAPARRRRAKAGQKPSPQEAKAGQKPSPQEAQAERKPSPQEVGES